MWLSVDPLADKYPNITGYAYTLNNPINLIDPDGMQVETDYYDKKTGQHLKHVDDGIDEAIAIDKASFDYLEKNNQLSNQSAKMFNGISLGKQSDFESFKSNLNLYNSIASDENKVYWDDIISFASGVASVGKDLLYNEGWNHWVGKNGKAYTFGFNGNQYTGGRNAFAKNLSTSVGKIGKYLGYVGYLSAALKLTENPTEAVIDGIINTIGIRGGFYGAIFSTTYNMMYTIQDVTGYSLRASTFLQPINPEPETEIRIPYRK